MSLPNTTNEDVPIGENAREIRTFGSKREQDSELLEKLAELWRGIDYPLDASGNRSYTLLGILF